MVFRQKNPNICVVEKDWLPTVDNLHNWLLRGAEARVRCIPLGAAAEDGKGP
jgi:hypothetical protein